MLEGNAHVGPAAIVAALKVPTLTNCDPLTLFVRCKAPFNQE